MLWWQAFGWLFSLKFIQDLGQLLYEPGMQHRIGDGADSFGPYMAGGWTKEGEQFGGSPALILVRLQGWVRSRLPAGPWLRDSLIGSGFIFI